MANIMAPKSSVLMATSSYSLGCSVLPVKVSTEPFGFLRVSRKVVRSAQRAVIRFPVMCSARSHQWVPISAKVREGP